MTANREVNNDMVIPSRNDANKVVLVRDIPTRDVRRDINDNSMVNIPSRDIRRDINDNNIVNVRDIPVRDVNKNILAILFPKRNRSEFFFL
jgi:hypothetical protein